MDSTSRWLVGSSKISRLALSRTIIESAIRARSPPESEPARRSTVSPLKPNAPRWPWMAPRFHIGRRSAVMSYSDLSCGTCPRSCRYQAGRMESPRRSSPAASRISPSRARSSVVLPAPLGPTRPTTSPRVTRAEKRSSRTRSSICTRTSWATSTWSPPRSPGGNWTVMLPSSPGGGPSRGSRSRRRRRPLACALLPPAMFRRMKSSSASMFFRCLSNARCCESCRSARCSRKPA